MTSKEHTKPDDAGESGQIYEINPTQPDGEQSPALNGTASCHFCGQFVSVNAGRFADQDEADEYATMRCDCKDGWNYRAMKRHEQERSAALLRAEKQVESMFGGGAVGYGLIPAIDEVKQLILAAATLVYDEQIKDMTVSITSCVKAKISKSPKGKIVFNRSDVAAFKQEA